MRCGVVTVTTLLLSGCRVGTDLPAVEPAELEVEEAIALSEALVTPTLANTVFSTNHVSFAHSHSDLGVHSHPVSGPWVHTTGDPDGPQLGHHNLFEIDVTVEPDCASGGSVILEAQVTGEGNPGIEVGAVHYVMIQTHAQCTLDLGESVFVVDGAPYLTVEAHAVNNGTTTTVTGLLEGAVAWQAEAKAGTCTVEASFAGAAPSLDELTAVTLTGSVCGFEIEAEIAAPVEATS